MRVEGDKVDSWSVKVGTSQKRLPGMNMMVGSFYTHRFQNPRSGTCIYNDKFEYYYDRDAHRVAR